MICCHKKNHKKKFKKFEKKYGKNEVLPFTQELKIIDENETLFIKNKLLCSGCNKSYEKLDDFIICGGCEKYFHCKIAGKCIGKNCMNLGFDGEIHRTQYCYCCIQLYYGGNKCLCRNCEL